MIEHGEGHGKLEISNSLLDSIRRHGERTYPNECCGALLGVSTENGGKAARALLPLENRREDGIARTRFLVTADDYRAAEKRAHAERLEIVGFYHSHPDHPERPSEYDREHALPWYSYVIVRIQRGEAKETACWRLAEDRSHFLRETIEEPAASK